MDSPKLTTLEKAILDLELVASSLEKKEEYGDAAQVYKVAGALRAFVNQTHAA
jgi:hypothetical protein